MNLSDALFMALVFTVVYLVCIGGKIFKLDFSVMLPENRKHAKLKKLLAPRDSPMQGSNLRRDLRKAFENILLPLGKADKDILPARMDRNFRRRLEHQIEQLARQGLCRDIRLTDVVPPPKNNFRHWNDDGREWREAVLQCCVLERFVPAEGGRPVREIYRPNACFRVLQSRHIRSADREQQKGSYYANKVWINCPSCGARIQLSSQQVVCPYCDGVIQSDFYDWQTETFELFEEIGTNLLCVLLLLSSSTVLFFSLFLCLWLIKDTHISLTVGVGAALSVLLAVIAVFFGREARQKQLSGKIARYSENYLRSCINEALYDKGNRPDLMDYSVGTIVLKKVVNTEETTTVKASVHIRETYLPEGQPPYEKRSKRTLVLQRARHPQRRKSDGSFFTEKECPSCGANFIPDENGCCSFCGYGLQVVSAKWIMQTPKRGSRDTAGAV